MIDGVVGLRQPDAPLGQAEAPRLYARILDAAYGALKGVSRRNLVIGGDTFTTGDIKTGQWMMLAWSDTNPPPSYAHAWYRIVGAEEDVEAVNDYFYERGWTDGLPIVPPTEDRVQRLLAGMPRRNPDDLISLVPPRMGRVSRALPRAIGVRRATTSPIRCRESPRRSPTGTFAC